MRQFLLFALMISTASAFFVRTLPQTPSTARSITRSSGRRSAVTVMKAGENESGYWQGEWVCADCGYIYDKDDFGGKYFEVRTEQQPAAVWWALMWHALTSWCLLLHSATVSTGAEVRFQGTSCDCTTLLRCPVLA